MNAYPGGVWPVMLTPLHRNGEIDEDGLRALVEWYIAHGVDGLFACCQSSEIYWMNLAERVRITEITRSQAAGRVPVVASGHISDDFDEQVRELEAIAATGVDAVILITNHLARADESDGVWMSNMERLISRLDPAMNLGAYECPLPYKRLMSPEMAGFVAETGRFYFLKDTCCDAATIREKLAAIRGTNLKLYNANTTTALESLLDGAPGYSGIMANFHPELYVWLTRNPRHPKAQRVQDMLTLASLIERQLYPVNAKYHLKEIEKLPIATFSRAQDDALLSETFRTEVRMMNRAMNALYEEVCG
ncbi:MAG: dihydrodipicolinate synthase family protein [Clostridiales bacterium]|jgi:4-hydroxy-tetrahydrodipicolinate synthase|nr:dihydrodipicolinate synthase family protein [Clostridiales bacterium]OPZ70040.1 MAG: putative DapA-like lyase [Firmicutes bacterium ADurb.Bin467]